jgi:hypothetical protein
LRAARLPIDLFSFDLRVEDEKLWLKLERRSDSKIALLRSFGRTTAKGEVGLYVTRDRLWRNVPTVLCLRSIPQIQPRNLVQERLSLGE